MEPATPRKSLAVIDRALKLEIDFFIHLWTQVSGMRRGEFRCETSETFRQKSEVNLAAGPHRFVTD
jgi:hypothetical protein